MQYTFRFIITVLFFIWLLPLGIFIKPSQEKVACDGQRAVCMCSQMQAKVSGSSVEGFGLKAFSGAQKQESFSGGSAGHYFLSFNPSLKNVLKLSFLNREILFAYGDQFLRSIEHIPKA